jgi:SAM-dependent methyltransferase
LDKDQLHWDKRFAARANEPGDPESFLVQHCNHLNKGSVLDLASGDGRHSLFLASKGFSVTAVDISPVALSRLDHFASRQALHIRTMQMDFDDKNSPPDAGAFEDLFDNLIIFFFKPPALLWQVIPDLLKPDGKILLCTFNLQQHNDKGFSRRFCLEPGELLTVHPQLGVELQHSFEDNGRFLDAYLFKKMTTTDR